MSIITRVACVSVALGLAACSSTGSNQLTRQDKSLEPDSAYIAQIEAAARQRGVGVKWVNPPRMVDRQHHQRED